MPALIVAVSVAAFGIAGAAPAAVTPRELAPVERQAVELAARYLEDGPAAWWPYLAEDSWLARLGPDAAAMELELRAGPPAGARWRLQTVPEAVAVDSAVFVIEFPSGIDEILQLTLVPDEPDWKIRDVTVSTRQVTTTDVGFELVTTANAGDTGRPRPPSPSPALPLIASLVLLWLMMMAWRREAPWGLRLALIAALIVTAGLVASRIFPGRSQSPATAGSAAAQRATADQVLLRRAAATGSDLQATTREAELWRAQQLASELRLNQAEALLAALPTGKDGRSELLRGRLGLLRMRPVDAVSAYERALEILPRHDGLVLEVARTCELLGFEERARRYYDELAEMGSRQAEIYYELARRVLMDDLWSRAAEYFENAWHQQPRRREEVLGQPVLAALLERRNDLESLLDLSSVKEPAVRCRGLSQQPMAVPESFSASLIGSLLVLETTGGGALEIPGGCRLAPPGVEVFDAGSWQQRRDRRLLDQDPAHTESRHHLADAIDALVRRGRWQEVVRRTEGLSVELASAFPELARHRAEALHRAGRKDAARQLLLDLATVNSDQQRVDPATLYQLAELLVTEQQYDLALRLMAKANAELPFDVSRQRMLQVQIEKRLATLSLEYESEHFELIYPPERSHRYAQNVARILEAERRRLRQWIPLESDVRIKVFLLDFDDWRASHGGGIEILGLFDGRIHVPFGEVAFFKPRMVSIITHELAHAMISELTRDRAPRWFQEGLAQHVEMAAGRLNPIPGYRDTGSLLAFPVIETVLDQFGSQQLVTIAYEEAQWALHFIESRYGVDAIHRLLKAFGDGSTTEDAIRTVLGKSIEEFDRELWTWCLGDAPQLWPRKIFDYTGLPG